MALKQLLIWDTWLGKVFIVLQLGNQFFTERIFLGNEVLHPYYAVPDSCCIRPQEGCGRDIFKGHSLKKMAEYVKVIDYMLSRTGCSVAKSVENKWLLH